MENSQCDELISLGDSMDSFEPGSKALVQVSKRELELEKMKVKIANSVTTQLERIRAKYRFRRQAVQREFDLENEKIGEEEIQELDEKLRELHSKCNSEETPPPPPPPRPAWWKRVLWFSY